MWEHFTYYCLKKKKNYLYLKQRQNASIYIYIYISENKKTTTNSKNLKIIQTVFSRAHHEHIYTSKISQFSNIRNSCRQDRDMSCHSYCEFLFIFLFLIFFLMWVPVLIYIFVPLIKRSIWGWSYLGIDWYVKGMAPWPPQYPLFFS